MRKNSGVLILCDGIVPVSDSIDLTYRHSNPKSSLGAKITLKIAFVNTFTNFFVILHPNLADCLMSEVVCQVNDIVMTPDFTPRKAAYFTLGCKLNFAETSTIGKILADKGFRRAKPAGV